MSKENILFTNPEEVDPISRLVRSIRIVREYRRSAEQNLLSAGSAVAEYVLLENIPTLDFIADYLKRL